MENVLIPESIYIFKALKDHDRHWFATNQSWKNYPVVKALYLARGSPQWKGMSFMWRDVTSILLCIEWGFSLWSLPKSFNNRKIIITILLSATFIYLHDPSWNPLSTSRNGQDIYNHITSYVIFIVCIKMFQSSGCAAPNFTPCEGVKAWKHLRIDRQMKCTTKMKAKLGKSNQLTCIEIALVWQENMCWIRKNPYCLPFLPQSCRLKTTLISRTLILEGPILHFMIVEGRVFTSLAIHLNLSICWRVNWCWGGMFFWCGDSN